MTESARCPNCGAGLVQPGQPCPFCAEAQRLVQRLAEQDEVGLCARCGALLEPGDKELCAACRKVPAGPAPAGFFARRDDRVAVWIRDRFVEPSAERQGIVCPSCGAGVPPLAVYCSQCGQQLAGATPNAAAAPAAEPGTEGTPVPAPTGRSRWAEFVAFWRDQFRPTGPVVERPPRPWWQRAGEFLGNLLGTSRSKVSLETWLLILVGVLLAGLAAMAIFWAQLLRGGDIFFR